MVTRGLMRTAALVAALVLAGCGGASTPAPRPDPGMPPVPARPVDQCGAASLQHLVGQPRTEIPVPVDVTSRRVTCTECPLTEDYSPSRLNILYNRDTGLIERVYCG